jgi:hypothetical protein
MIFLLLITISAGPALESLLRPWFHTPQWRARVVETFFSAIVGTLGVLSIIAHFISDLPLDGQTTQLGIATFYIGLGFFIYHLHRVIYVPGYVRSLIGHHLGMILVISFSLIAQKAQVYVLLASIPLSSAAVRNIRWFWRASDKPKWYKGAVATAASYAALETIPPLLGIIHFFAIGVYQISLPFYFWAGVVVPSIALSLMTFYWSAQFVQKVLSSYRDVPSLSVFE